MFFFVALKKKISAELMDDVIILKNLHSTLLDSS